MKCLRTVVLVTALTAASAGIASAQPGPTPPGPPPGPAAPTTIDEDGTYTVGTEIAPGTYSSPGPVADGVCYWKRQGGPDGTEMLDNAMTKKPQIVQILPSDTAFRTSGCQPWAQTSAPPPAVVPPLDALGQLRTMIDTINAGAGPSGGQPIPRP